MNVNFSLFFFALGLAFVMEACLWLLVPRNMRDAAYHIASCSDEQIRKFGFAALVAGLVFCILGNILKG